MMKVNMPIMLQIILIAQLGFLGIGCTDSTNHVKSNNLSSSSHDQLNQKCKDVLDELQDRFNRTATYHGMNPLKEWFINQLDTLSFQYDKQMVIETMNQVAISDSNLKYPVPTIVINFLKEYEQ